MKTNQVLIQRSVDYIREYLTANENPVIAKDVGCQNWIPPADHEYKVNVEGAIFQTQHQAGIGPIGVLVHDSQGKVIAAISKKLLPSLVLWRLKPKLLKRVCCLLMTSAFEKLSCRRVIPL